MTDEKGADIMLGAWTFLLLAVIALALSQLKPDPLDFWFGLVLLAVSFAYYSTFSIRERKRLKVSQSAGTK